MKTHQSQLAFLNKQSRKNQLIVIEEKSSQMMCMC